MMKYAIRILVPVLLALSVTPALAEFKIGYVNGQRVVNESPQAEKARQRLKKDFDKRDQELQQVSKRLQTMQADIEKNSVTMSESDKRTKEREFNDLNRDFQRRQREFREDLSLRQNEETAAIFEYANKAIKKIAETEKFDLIVQEAVYFSPRVDITEKVIKALAESAK
jgi:outer membrane protein